MWALKITYYSFQPIVRDIDENICMTLTSYLLFVQDWFL
jgi:hypothetical protein